MTTEDITLTVNGTEHEISLEPRVLLVHALRNELGYTGPNIGCESSLCGACTVHVDGDPIKSCTMFAVQADGAEITTIEGIADGEELSPVQVSLHEEHGLQCGYCTPGFVMTATAFLDQTPDPSKEEIREAFEGNVCRCTGYQNIVKAIESAAKKRQNVEAAGGGD